MHFNLEIKLLSIVSFAYQTWNLDYLRTTFLVTDRNQALLAVKSSKIKWQMKFRGRSSLLFGANPAALGAFVDVHAALHWAAAHHSSP